MDKINAIERLFLDFNVFRKQITIYISKYKTAPLLPKDNNMKMLNKPIKI